jgi:hypothetical protein
MTSSGIVLGISSRMKILFMALNLDRKLRYTSFRLIIACIEGKITESFSRKKRNNKMKQEPYRIKYLHTQITLPPTILSLSLPFIRVPICMSTMKRS